MYQIVVILECFHEDLTMLLESIAQVLGQQVTKMGKLVCMWDELLCFV